MNTRRPGLPLGYLWVEARILSEQVSTRKEKMTTLDSETPVVYKLSTARTYMVNQSECNSPGRGPETDTNNDAKSFTLLLFDCNEPTHQGNNNNDVFEFHNCLMAVPYHHPPPPPTIRMKLK